MSEYIDALTPEQLREECLKQREKAERWQALWWEEAEKRRSVERGVPTGDTVRPLWREALRGVGINVDHPLIIAEAMAGHIEFAVLTRPKGGAAFGREFMYREGLWRSASDPHDEPKTLDACAADIVEGMRRDVERLRALSAALAEAAK